MTMKLMHISLVGENIHETIKEFIPLIPTKPAYMEDVTQERICTSDTVIGCMKGHPSIMNDLDTNLPYFDPMITMSNQTCLLELGKSGFLCQLYHFEVPEEWVKKPSELNGLVPDVDFTNEHWIMNPTVPVKMQYVLVEDATRYKDLNDEIVENYEYTIFDTVEELGTMLNCLDYHTQHEFILKEFSLNSQSEIWGVKFSTEQAQRYLQFVKEKRNAFCDLEDDFISTNPSISELPEQITF